MRPRKRPRLTTVRPSSMLGNKKLSSQLSQRRVRLLCGSVLVKYNWKRIFWTEPYRTIFNHCDVIGLMIYQTR